MADNEGTNLCKNYWNETIKRTGTMKCLSYQVVELSSGKFQIMSSYALRTLCHVMLYHVICEH